MKIFSVGVAVPSGSFGVVFDIEVELVNRIDRSHSPGGFVSFRDLGPPKGLRKPCS